MSAATTVPNRSRRSSHSASLAECATEQFLLRAGAPGEGRHSPSEHGHEGRPTAEGERLADQLAAEGLVKFIDKPNHRRSKLVQLTRKGDARYRELNARFLEIASTLGNALGEADIRKTTEIVRQLSDDVKARSERLS